MDPNESVPCEVSDTYDREQAERFYTGLRRRITDWLDSKANVPPRTRDTLLILPDFFALLVRLIGDGRVDATLKAQLLLVSAYVLSPIDLIPDFILPLGLMDDAVALAFVLSRVARIMADPGVEIMREHWEGQGDVLYQIEKIAASADELLNERILAHLRKMGR
jgi:uncharacterized membrane protein YkvA (DUF1232 family)